jgi:hypothetical protein
MAMSRSDRQANSPAHEAHGVRARLAIATVIALSALVAGGDPALAQSSLVMWGTQTQSGTTGGSQSIEQSSQMHAANGIVAGQVNAARDDILYNGTSVSITSIGSQSVINTTIYGDNNVVDVDATQESSNSGDVDNNGSITITPEE